MLAHIGAFPITTMLYLGDMLERVLAEPQEPGLRGDRPLTVLNIILMLAHHNITIKLSFYHIMHKLDEKNTTRHSFYEHSPTEYWTLTIYNWISIWTKKSKICFISTNGPLLKNRLGFHS